MFDAVPSITWTHRHNIVIFINLNIFLLCWLTSVCTLFTKLVYVLFVMFNEMWFQKKQTNKQTVNLKLINITELTKMKVIFVIWKWAIDFYLSENEGVIFVYLKMDNFTSISWREQVTFFIRWWCLVRSRQTAIKLDF